MPVKQISVFLENKAGRLAVVTRWLGVSGINILALSIAATSDFGILRLLVDQPEAAGKVLRAAGFMVSETDVIAVEVPDRPGGLAKVLDILGAARINIEYLYAFMGVPSHGALVIFRVVASAAAMQALEAQQIRVLDGAEVYAL